MRSKSFTMRLPMPLRDILEERAKQLGYSSASAYLIGLIRYDLLTQKGHRLTTDLSKLPLAEQDRIDDEVARLFKTGEALNGSWFERKLEEATKKTNTDKDKVLRQLMDRISS